MEQETTVEFTLDLERETKGSFRFNDKADSPFKDIEDDSVLGTIYIKKRMFRDGHVPQRIKVEVSV